MKYFYSIFFLAVLLFISTKAAAQSSAIDSLKISLNNETDEIKRVDIYNNIAIKFIEIRNWKAGIFYADSALINSKKINYKKGLANASYAKGRSLILKGDLIPALELIETSLEISKSLLYKQGLANAYAGLGSIASLQGRLNEADSLNNLSLIYFIALDNKKAQAGMIRNIGFVYFQKSQYPKALSYFFQSKQIFELINEVLMAASVSLNIGDVYCQQKDFVKANNFFNEAIELFKKNNSISNLLDAYISMGCLYMDQENYKEALKYFELGKKLNVEEKDALVVILNNEAITYAELNQDSLSLATFMQVLQIHKDNNNSLGRVKVLGNIAHVYTNLKDLKKAEDALLEAKKIAQKNNYTKQLRNCFEDLSDIYKTQGNYLKSFECYKISVTYNDSIVNESTEKEIARLKIQYETENKEKEIKGLQIEKQLKEAALFLSASSLKEQELLNEQKSKDLILSDAQNRLKTLALENQKKENDQAKQKFLLSKKEADLKKLELSQEKLKQKIFITGIIILLAFSIFTYIRFLQRKKIAGKLNSSLIDLKEAQSQLIVIAKEKQAEELRVRISTDIHDEIGSNLTKISMLGNMLSSKLNGTSPELTEQLEKITSYARDVNNSMSEIVWAINPKQDSLENLLGYMRIHITDFLKDSGIDFQINFPESTPDIILNPELKRNLFLVLKESLNNSVKYSSARNVSVSFSLNKNNFNLSIADDGNGFDISEVISSKGGNGLLNLKQRMQQLSCIFKLQSTKGNGCRIEVSGLV